MLRKEALEVLAIEEMIEKVAGNTEEYVFLDAMEKIANHLHMDIETLAEVLDYIS